MDIEKQEKNTTTKPIIKTNKQMDIRQQYNERATRFAIEYGFTDVSEHIIDVMVSIMCTRDKTSHAGGSFVQSVVNNNLYLALSRADADCRKNIYLLAMCKENCFLNEFQSQEVLQLEL